MEDQNTTCYMCEEQATSREHVPPRCLFPEGKDIPGADFRKNLITVPSCAKHNNSSSKDDEYLLYVLTSCQAVNEIGEALAGSKLVRAVTKDPTLMNRMLVGSTPETIEDAKGSFDTIAVRAEKERLWSRLEMLGRGLYFHHFKRKWSGTVRLLVEFMVWLDGPDIESSNRMVEDFRAHSDVLFGGAPSHGENPKVFFYNLPAKEQSSGSGMRLTFYGGAKITILFPNS